MNRLPAIIVVTFNRAKSLERLLGSLQKGNYPNNAVELIISIDFSEENQEILRVANDFEWNHGNKSIIQHEKNLGLKKHILKCGDLTEKYDNIIVLEDDLYVSPNFYHYVIRALDFVKDKEYVGGVSLYNHKMNTHTGEYFSALEDGYDNWYFQYAASWGQAWNSNQWRGFRRWLEKNPVLKKSASIPEKITDWSDKSWLKLFIAYLIDEKMFFLYPKISLTTNFHEEGTHSTAGHTHFQTELLMESKTDYHFSRIEESSAIYDAFFENMYLSKIARKEEKSLCVDLYGYKPISEGEDYLLTSKKMNFRIVRSYARSMRPIEANILNEIEGNDLFLYDLSRASKNHHKNDENYNYRKILYSTKFISYNSSFILFKYLFRHRVHNALKKMKMFLTK